MIGTLVFSLAVSAASLGDGFVQFSRSPALMRERVEVSIGVLRINSASDDSVHGTYWARRTVMTQQGEAVSWADSRTCPRIRSVLLALRDLPAPRADVPGIGSETDIVLDGVGYRLHAMAAYGRNPATLEYSSNVETPLARWVDESLEQLAPCWSATVPQRD